MKPLISVKAANPCMMAEQSCSACCGLFNLKLADSVRHEWVSENTRRFLSLDISRAEAIVQYRKTRETETEASKIRDDIYVCPFIGFIGKKTGCMLHPQGSPHPQIALWPHPQNFSFYGEGICLSYDCLAKDRAAHSVDFFTWAKTASNFSYARLASDHTLHRALENFAMTPQQHRRLFTILAAYYEKYAVVTSSFEDVEKQVPDSYSALCHFLASRIASSAPTDDTNRAAPNKDRIKNVLLRALRE